jgi:hypothetical protein
MERGGSKGKAGEWGVSKGSLGVRNGREGVRKGRAMWVSKKRLL